MKNIIPLLLLAIAPFARADVKLNALFSDHVVLQRERPVPVWGDATPGEHVSVRFNGQTVNVVTDQAGHWQVKLAPMPASAESRDLEVRGANELILHDVLVGDVWLCGGQSNMERQVGLRSGQLPLDNWEQEVADANLPLIRHFAVARTPSDTPKRDTAGRWDVCSPETVINFTAVGYFFARDLQKSINVPIGLIHSSWGGTPAETWMSPEILTSKFPGVLTAQQKAVSDYAVALEKFKADEAVLTEKWTEESNLAKAEGKPIPRKPGPPRDPSISQNRPSSLFQGMIYPLLPFGIRGVIWYQGESNCSRAVEYRSLFPALIEDWRSHWGEGDFPFLFVQIAPYHGNTPELRDAQLFTWRTTANTAMVVTTDLGDAENIHPTHKEPIGARLALAARALAYGEKLEYSGPRFTNIAIDGSRAILHFDHVGSGLVAKEGPLRGFEISEDSKKFIPAIAEIQGDTVVVSSPSITVPAAVRFGWANVPDVNLYNGDGLPASPFRTDDWLTQATNQK